MNNTAAILIATNPAFLLTMGRLWKVVSGSAEVKRTEFTVFMWENP